MNSSSIVQKPQPDPVGALLEEIRARRMEFEKLRHIPRDIIEQFKAIGVYRAEIEREGSCEVSSGERNYCTRCATALWLWDPRWPELIHPFASAIDTPLPAAPSRVHLMLKERPAWVPLPAGPGEEQFEEYPELSLADWHRQHGLWVE